MKNIKPFGPSIGKAKISKRFINKLNEDNSMNAASIPIKKYLVKSLNNFFFILFFRRNFKKISLI